jgi:hypothetical protein
MRQRVGIVKWTFGESRQVLVKVSPPLYVVVICN